MSMPGRERDRVRVAALLFAGVSAAALAALPATVDRSALHVCANPDNAPYSQRDGGGLDIRVAHAVGAYLGMPVRYHWTERRGAQRPIGADCDLVLGSPARAQGLLATLPYFRAGYVFAYRAERIDGLRSFDDPRLRRVRIGLAIEGSDLAATPPGRALARRALGANVIGYAPLGNAPVAERIVAALGDGSLDVALLRAPEAAYFARRQSLDVQLVPAVDPQDGAAQDVAFAIGVRPGQTRLRDAVDAALVHLRPQLRAIARDYEMPLEPPRGTGPALM